MFHSDGSRVFRDGRIALSCYGNGLSCNSDMNADLISATCILITDYTRCLYRVGLLLTLEFEKRCEVLPKSDLLGIFETHNKIMPKLLHFFSGIYFLWHGFDCCAHYLQLWLFCWPCRSIRLLSTAFCRPAILSQWSVSIKLLKTNNQNAPARKSRYPNGSRIFLLQN